jgi:hypothetical protein
MDGGCECELYYIYLHVFGLVSCVLCGSVPLLPFCVMEMLDGVCVVCVVRSAECRLYVCQECRVGIFTILSYLILYYNLFLTPLLYRVSYSFIRIYTVPLHFY